MTGLDLIAILGISAFVIGVGIIMGIYFLKQSESDKS